MERANALRARLQELRQSFDAAFAREPGERSDDVLDLLAIRVGRDAYAVRLAEVAALETRCVLTPVPSEHRELLGIAGLRGVVAAVFDLAALLGASAGEPTPWILLAKGSPCAFAFAAFDGVLSVSAAELAHGEVAAGARRREVVWHDGRPLSLIDLAGLVANLERRPRLAPREDLG